MTQDEPDAAPRWRVAVRELCAFAAKAGDLDLRFTPAPSAREGQEGHRLISSRRGATVRSEYPCRGRYGGLEVHGRADGFDTTRGRVEEVKTHRGPVERIKDNHRALAWAQAKVYAHLICAAEQRAQMEVAVVYLEIAAGDESVSAETLPAAALKAFFDALCQRYIGWAQSEAQHRSTRDAGLAVLRFPHPVLAGGQRALAEASWRAIRDGRCLLAEAPTGIGKTLGTLFPALKAAPAQGLDKLFFLCAKTSGRALALEALAQLQQQDREGAAEPIVKPLVRTEIAHDGLGDRMAAGPVASVDGLAAPLPASGDARTPREPKAPTPASDAEPPVMRAAQRPRPLRVVEWVARDKQCVHPDKACHGQSCPLATGFYDRLPAARADAVAALSAGAGQATAAPERSAETLRAVAAHHAVCPYYLTQEMARWADVVVADYNAWFDRSAPLHAMTVQNEWRVAVLVDEAHNMVDRGRAMYSAQLDGALLQRARRQATAAGARALNAVLRALKRLDQAAAIQAAGAPDRITAGPAQGASVAAAAPAAYQLLPQVPDALLRAIQQALSVLSEELTEQAERGPEDLQSAYFELSALDAVAAQFGPHALWDLSPPHADEAANEAGRQRSRRRRAAAGAARPATPPARALRLLTLRNVVPAPHLQPRFASAHAVLLFSATLHPPDYYQNLLGLPSTTRLLRTPSPFRAEQLAVRVLPHISTRYHDRPRALPLLAEQMAAQFHAQPGNYLAFFSSHAFLAEAHAALQAEDPWIPTWTQSRQMSEPERDAFLARFTPQGRGIGFAVLGGVFAEGINLPGSRLIGAFIATLGLPQLNPINDAFAARMEQLFGAGTGQAYSYLLPGLRKVVQAAGRVIRNTEDTGVLLLMDDRYARAETQRLLPPWWAVEVQRRPRAAGPARVA